MDIMAFIYLKIVDISGIVKYYIMENILDLGEQINNWHIIRTNYWNATSYLFNR